MPVHFNDDVVFSGLAKDRNDNIVFGGETKRLTIPSAEFVGPTSDNRGTAIYNSGVLLPGSKSTYTAPVLLPHGAKITKVSMRVKDNDSTVGKNVTLTFDRFNNVGNPGISVSTITFFSTTDAATSPNFQEISTTSVQNDTVNTNFAYSLSIYNRSDVANVDVQNFTTALDSVVIE